MEVSETGYMSKKITVKKARGIRVFGSVLEEVNYGSAISPQDSQEGR